MRKEGCLLNDHPTFNVLAPTQLLVNFRSSHKSHTYRCRSLSHCHLVSSRFGYSLLAVVVAILERENLELDRLVAVAIYHLLAPEGVFSPPQHVSLMSLSF